VAIAIAQDCNWPDDGRLFIVHRFDPLASAATTSSGSTATLGFFAELPRLASAPETFDAAHYRRAPDDWAVVATDIVDSTKAIADGRHKTVNFVAATAIAALRNLCAPTPIPFLFGGDGAIVMVPPQFVPGARVELARVRAMAARDFGITLRVGLVTVAGLRRLGSEVAVARYEPTTGNSFGVFLGGGVGRLEAAIKGRGDAALKAESEIPGALDDGAPVDLEGLSCRWDELRSTRGKMVTLILQGTADLREIHAHVLALAAPEGQAQPVREETLKTHWPPRGFMLEVHARRRGGSTALWTLRVLAKTLIAKIVFARGRPVGNFDPARYRREIVSNTDFCKHDDTLCFVVDCALDRVDEIERYVSACAAEQGLRYGVHISDTALMTCLVTAADAGLHVHFVDGGAGGYTSAATKLKQAMAAPV
jgi:hypothetical protein